MGHISNRLHSLESEIVAIVEAIPSVQCRKLALYVAEHALQYAKIHNNPVVIAALQSLYAEELDDSAAKHALSKLARELDDAELDIEALLEQGKPLEAEQTAAIAKARAADALLATFEDIPEEALADVVYEAYYAVDAKTTLVLKWLTEYK